MKPNNQVQYIGNLGADAETKTFENGSSVTNFSLGIDDSYKNKAGEKIRNTVWINCVAWNATGEIISKYVKKGSKILVSGATKVERYENKAGEKREAFKCSVDSFYFMDSKPIQEKLVDMAEDFKEEEEDDLPF